MSVVKINSVEVPDGMDEAFQERFAKRAGAVENSSGFEEFLLLRPTDGSRRWFVFTRWASEQAFRDWVAGNDFARAHAHASADKAAGAHGGGQAPVATGADLLAFEVVERVAANG